MEIFYIILILKSELDKKDLRNKTALELAIFLDHYECARLLVENGSDCGIITNTGWNRKKIIFNLKKYS